MATRQYIGARYVPIFFNNNGSNEWVAGVSYEPLTIVTYLNNSFTSTKAVPANIGNPASAEGKKYWANTGLYNAQVTELKNTVDEYKDNVDKLQTNVDNYKYEIDSYTAEIDNRFKTFINTIYPVGSIYISYNNINPSTLFGGNWEQIKDVFLLGAGDTYALGTTGGEASHLLTIDEMPQHSHNEYIGVYGYSGWTATTLQNYSVAISSNTAGTTNSAYHSPNERLNMSSVSANSTSGSTGGSASHNNMPPFSTVNIWKRIG